MLEFVQEQDPSPAPRGAFNDGVATRKSEASLRIVDVCVVFDV